MVYEADVYPSLREAISSGDSSLLGRWIRILYIYMLRAINCLESYKKLIVAIRVVSDFGL